MMNRRTALTGTAALALAAGLPAIRIGAEEDRAGLQPDRRRERMAHRQHRVDQAGRQGRGHRAEVRRRPAEAGEPDQGDPLLHRAEGRRHRLLAGGGKRLRDRAARSQGRQDPGDPDRPRRQREGRHAVRHLHGLGLPGRRPQGRQVDAGERQGQAGQHRRTAGHRRLGAGDRPQEGLRGSDQGQARSTRSCARRPATSPAPRARK
jgi:hypothetical protein